jgi:NTP pyrophosphatase (non-canonical NTP hydrolase)
LDFSEYQRTALRGARYPKRGSSFVYPVLGLVGESGEVAEKIKKILRDKGGRLDSTSREDIKKELGDILWYMAALCDELSLDMSDVAATNLQKRESRLKRGKVRGSGDDR